MWTSFHNSILAHPFSHSPVFAVKELDSLYSNGEYEIGATSVRLFVAYYTGLPFDTTAQEIYLPGSATELLFDKNNLTPEQTAYLEKYTVDQAAGNSADVPLPETTSAVVETPAASSDYTVKGKTTFGELITWDIPTGTIEELIGASLPDPAMILKDYVSANGLNFETLKPALQAEVDKVRP